MADDEFQHSDQHGAQQVYMGGDGRRSVEVISGIERRRRWSLQEKSQIVDESFAPGANVSEVARRYGMNLGLLHHWRRLKRGRSPDPGQSFVPLLALESEASGAVRCSPQIEIDMEGMRLRIMGPVDALTLRAVISALRAR